MEYEIINGRVQTGALEYHILDHCNLNCEQCCSFSPLLKSWCCDTAQFEKDLRRISKFVQPALLKIAGGEPMLHPQLPELLQIAHNTAIASHISITTNGHLLHKLPEEYWQYFQMLTVSIYPYPELSRQKIKWISRKAIEHSISVSWKVQDKFVKLNREKIATYQEAKETFNGCWIPHRCNSVKDGRFYSCTRPQYIQKIAENPQKFKEDGVDLYGYNEEALPCMIKAHLEATEPINSCSLCRGGQAELGTHRQLDAQSLNEERTKLVNLCKQI